MRHLFRPALLLTALAALALGACAAPRNETWIGDGVGVTLSELATTPRAPTALPLPAETPTRHE